MITRNSRSYLFTIIMVLLTSVASLAHGKDTFNKDNEIGTINVGYVEFPPFEFTSSSGKPEGIFIDVTRKTLKKAGYKSKFTALPISRVYLYLQEGQIDVWPGLSGVPALQGHVYESKSTPMHITLCAWHLKNHANLTSIASLREERVILVNGYTYGGLLYKLTAPDSGFKVSFTPNHSSGLTMLEKDRGDYFLDYLEPVRLELKKRPVENLTYSMLNTRKAAFIVSKRNKNSSILIDQIDVAYNSLVDSGDIISNN